MLLGHQRVASGRIDFGSEQVILVRNDEARRNLPPSLAESAIVLTVFEAKGLEFNDVLLWDFFKDSPAEKEVLMKRKLHRHHTHHCKFYFVVACIVRLLG
jgi:ATP-dependent exoDNAse (exonuclease V) beta subunit